MKRGQALFTQARRARAARAARAAPTLAVVGAAALLGGCASGAFDSDQPYQQIYVLAGTPERAPAGPILPVDVTVAMPEVRPGLDTERIATLYPDRRLDYFAASRWGGATDRMVQSVLVESLRNSGGLRSVQGDGAGFASEFVLHTEVTDFQAEYSGSSAMPEAHVKLVVTLGRFSDRLPIAAFVAQARAPADSNTLRSVVAAFERASQEAASEVVALTRAAIERAPPIGPSGAQNVDSPVSSISR